MPRISERQKLLKEIEGLIHFSYLDSSDSDSSMDDLEDGGDSEIDSDEELLELYAILDGRRYLSRCDFFKRNRDFVENNYFFRLPNCFFRQLTRMDKTSFIRLLSLIEDHPVFRNESQHQQAPVIVQLGAALDRLGHDGNGACIARSKELWGYGHGTLVNFTKRVIIAIRDRLHMYVRWPTRAERQRISAEFESKGFPGCVGLIDGTLVKLSQRPCNDGETYFDRKHNYSLNVQVVCDHRRKILFLYGGVPGSCQDITALKRSKLWKYIDAEGGSAVFASNEYLLGDSGYAPLRHLVPAFKGGADDRDKQDFNQCLSHARVVNEHCIGVLKSRWFSLKGIRTQLKVKKENEYVMRWIECCAYLHNFLLCHRDEWTSMDDRIIIDTPPDQNPSDGGTINSYEFRNRVVSRCLEINRRPGGMLNMSGRC